MYWPNINRDIEALIKGYEISQEHSKRNPKDPSISREIPLVLWTLLEMDFSLVRSINSTGSGHLIQVPCGQILPNETTKSVLNTLKGVYSDFGLPRRVRTDNGPCFKSQEFINFHAKLNVAVEKSSAYNHQSAGSVEQMVQTIKQILVKNAENAWLAMLISTDIPGVNKSPSEILNGC